MSDLESQVSRSLSVGSNSSRRSDPQYIVQVNKTPTNLTPSQRLNLRKNQMANSIARLKNNDMVDILENAPKGPVPPAVASGESTRPNSVLSHDSFNSPSSLFSAVSSRSSQHSFGSYEESFRKEDPLSSPIMYQNSEYMQIFEETRQRKKMLSEFRKISIGASCVDDPKPKDQIEPPFVIPPPPPPPPVPPKNKNLPSLPSITKNRSISTPNFHEPTFKTQAPPTRSVTSLPLGPKPENKMPTSPTSLKFFSYTRPTWLPPKASADKSKHQKDANDLIERALAKESKEQAQKVRALEKLSRQRQNDLECWQDMLNTIDLKEFGDKRAALSRDVWWRGVDSRLRSSIWWKFFRHHSDASIPTYIDRELGADLVRSVTNDLVYRGAEVVKVVGAFAYYLQKDGEDVINSYFPQLNDVICTLCIVYRNPYKAFSSLCQIYDTPVLKALLHGEIPTAFFARAESTFESVLPQLYAHFVYQGVSVYDWASDMVLGFLSPHASLSLSGQLIDIFLFENMNENVLLAAAITLMEQLQYKLYGSKDDIRATLHTRFTSASDHTFLERMKKHMEVLERK